MAHEVTEANFEEEVLNSDVPVLVDFWAPWCGPCRVLGPIVEELAGDNEGKEVKVLKLNVDENNAISSKYGVMSIPTVMVFKGGEPVHTWIGVQEKAVMQAKLDEVMGS